MALANRFLTEENRKHVEVLDRYVPLDIGPLAYIKILSGRIRWRTKVP